MEEIKITRETFKDLKFEVKFPEYAGYYAPCDCGAPDCTGEQIIYTDDKHK